MQYLPDKVGRGADTSVVLEHNGEELIWNVSAYHNFSPDNEMVLDINQYWSKQSKDRQDRIWALYKEINQTLEEVRNFQQLDEILKEQCKALFEIINWDSIIYYIRRWSNVSYPQDMPNEVSEHHAPELTYLAEDYVDLAGLIVWLKAAAPIITQYIYVVKDTVDLERRQYNAIKLFGRSELMTSPPVERLERYCNHFWLGKPKEMAGSALLAGLSSEEVPAWLVGITIYTKLVNAKLQQKPNEAKNYVKVMFHNVKGLCDDLATYFKDRVNEKAPPTTYGNDEDKTSVAENYKVKSDVNEGDIVSHEYQSHQGFLVGSMVDETLDKGLYWTCFNVIKEQEVDVNSLQRAICQWLLYPVVSPKAMFHIDYKGMMNYLATTQALLIHWGFPDIAVLLSSRVVPSTDTFYAQSRVTISNAQFEKLNEFYPHFLPQSRVKLETQSKRNAATNDIVRMVNDYAYSQWEFEGPSIIAEETHLPLGGRGATPADLEYQLAELVIRLNEHWRRAKDQ